MFVVLAYFLVFYTFTQTVHAQSVSVDDWFSPSSLKLKNAAPTDVELYEIRLYSKPDTVAYADFTWPLTGSYSIKNINTKPKETVIQFLSANRDWATHVVYNLPLGTVVTLVDSIITTGVGFLPGDYNFENQLRWSASIDLIGTGAPAAKVMDNFAWKTTVAWAWYTYDLSLGYLQVFAGTNFAMHRTVIFPSRFPTDTVIPIAAITDKTTRSWYINDKIASVDWSKMDTTVNFEFFRNFDGSGVSFDEITGQNYVTDGTSTTKVQYFKDLGIYGDTANTFSAFSWTMTRPIAVDIKSMKVPSERLVPDYSALRKTIQVKKLLGSHSVVTVNLEQSFVKRSSVTTSSSMTKAWSLECSIEAQYAAITVSATAAVSGSTTRENSVTKDKEESLVASETHEVTLDSSQEGTFQVTSVIPLVTVLPVTMEFTGRFTYDIPVRNGVVVRKGIWERAQNLTLTVSGNYCSDSTFEVKKI